MKIPKEIKEIVNDLPCEINDTGRSGDTILNYGKKYSLKISDNKESLRREYEKSLWVHQYLVSAKPYLYIEENDKAYFLREYINGKSLIDKEILCNPEFLIDYLVEAIKLLRTVDDKDCPFKSQGSEGDKFVHGDLCLPNIMVNDGKIVGFVDLENAGVGDEWFDYAWMLWSLEYNLGTNKYNKVLLDKLNITFDENKANSYVNV